MDVEDLDDEDLFGGSVEAGHCRYHAPRHHPGCLDCANTGPTFRGARLDEERGRPVRHVPEGAVSDAPPLDPDLVEVAYGYHANGYKGGGYAYRTGGLKVRVGSYVMVPATSRSPREQVATVVKIGSDYRGPTARLLRVHRHKHQWLRVCAGCGKREA